MTHKIYQLILSSRPISWVNTMYPFVMTYILLGKPSLAYLIVGGVFFLFPYNLLMYGINDVFDYESDVRNPRKVGVEGIVLKPALHKLTIISAVAIATPFIAYLLIASPNLQARLCLLGLIGTVIAYSAPKLRFKERAFIDSLTSSSHFVGPMLVAIAAAGGDWGHTWLYAFAFFLWGMASHAFGAVQDVIPDRKAHIGSVATRIGARRTVWLSAVLYVVAILLIVLQNRWETTCIAFALLLYVANVWPFRHITDKTAETAHTGWKRFIYINYICGAVITIVIAISAVK